MSSTRYAAEDDSFSQEAYAASGANGVCLLGNLVAARCKVAMRPEHRALCYFVQQLSRRDGGLKRVASEILEAFPERFSTAAMRRLGIKPGQVFTEDQRAELANDFPRSSEHDLWVLSDSDGPEPENKFPRMADALFAMCRAEADDCLEAALRAMCLDPRSDMTSVPFRYNLPRRRESYTEEAWWIDDFVSTLELFRQRHVTTAKGAIAETAITRMVDDAIGRAASFKEGVALLVGRHRSGKTVAAKNYCERHPGECVFIELESGEDDTTFFRSIARSIGTASAGQLTTVKLRGKIEDMLQAGHLTVIFDESHFLVPMKSRPTAPPKRLDWVRRSLVDKGVAVVLISTPQFRGQCEHYQERLGWNADQLLGRVVWDERLPETLDEKEIAAVARKIAPYADEVSVKFLTGMTVDASDMLFRIRRIVGNAEYLARQDGRSEPTRADLKRSIEELKRQLAPTSAATSQTPLGRVCKAPASRVQTLENTFAEDAPAPLARRAGMDSPAARPAGFGASERLQFTEAAASD